MQLRQSKSTIILHSTSQDLKFKSKKFSRNASLKKENFIEYCLINIEQANKTTPKISQQNKGKIKKAYSRDRDEDLG
ncbi:unnamed protein product [Paramecium sonneborni]|uniref:Uncharacterized protein n=1 Tax=Paramecium sonneborni TaxID=65129 RepID=A0A8S1QU10_9CILI|nr:unnamed protein product [Paramecium sonneborni]